MTPKTNLALTTFESPELQAIQRKRLIEADRAQGCTHPIRLKGSITVSDEKTGDLLRHWSSERDELNGTSYVPCKTRRADKCQSCARLYQGDAFRLIVDGLRGGEFIDESVKDHPAIFVTFTAPSFGPVHTHATQGEGENERIVPCHPRRGGEICQHGTNLSCTQRHQKDDYRIGQAICKDCFDYEGAATWNHFAGKLWRQTRIEIDKALAAGLFMTRREMRIDIARTQYVKIAEFQRRGLAHFHVAIRLDGPEGVVTHTTVDDLIGAVQQAHEKTNVATVDDKRIGWGPQLDIKVITNDDDRERLAGYFAKYATKSADAKGQLNQRIRDERHLEHLPVNDHLARLVRAAWKLTTDYEELNAARWAHQFGFGGHFMTKSRQTTTKDGVDWLGWSTTFKTLRQRRADHNAEMRKASWQALSPQAQLVIESRWEFVGAGFATPKDARIAATQRAQNNTTPAGQAA